ncbi:MAG: GNAT family N-acetyltransferase [Pseudomonadota bacterium]
MLERPIAKSERVDGMALYPMLSCADWSSIGHDLEDIASDWITATAVTDPLGDYDEALLQRSFHYVQPYKDHFIAEMTGPPETYVKKSHRQNARRALRKVEVEVCTDPMEHIDEWVALFDVLADRHRITGLRAFSRQSFAQQFCVPGMVMFRASVDGETVGLDLWYVDGDVAQGHLVAFNDKGYKNSASYATKWTLLLHFAERVRWVNFGGVPTATSSPDTGLEHFKRGWSNTTRKSYLCGCIFDDAAYQDLSRNIPDTSYFPAYRTGEL